MRSTRRLQNLVGTLPRWWKIENKAAVGGPAIVSIYDEIGGPYGMTAADFLSEMREINGDIEMHINSPGGDVFDGIAIYNQLRAAQKKGTVHIVVDGLAASAASFIAQAASPGHLEMAPHSQMMIHDGFALGMGNAADMLELAAQLDKASDNIAAIYADRTGKPAAHWRELMRAETWLSDWEAVECGLADRVQGTDDAPGSAGWDLSVYGRWSGTAVKNSAKSGGKNSGKPARVRNDDDMDDNEDEDGDTPIGNGWVRGADGKVRFDPDGDGDDDATPEGDTDHDYFDENGKQIKPIPPKPKSAKAKSGKKILAASDADVDNSAWDAAKAWHNGAVSDDPESFYRGICAGKRAGDPSKQNGWALPYKYHPDDPPNAAGVRNALARLSSTEGLINKAEAEETLEGLMKKINPEYKPDNLDAGLLSALLLHGLGGGPA